MSLTWDSQLAKAFKPFLDVLAVRTFCMCLVTVSQSKATLPADSTMHNAGARPRQKTHTSYLSLQFALLHTFWVTRCRTQGRTVLTHHRVLPLSRTSVKEAHAGPVPCVSSRNIFL